MQHRAAAGRWQAAIPVERAKAHDPKRARNRIMPEYIAVSLLRFSEAINRYPDKPSSEVSSNRITRA
jgi:hypothetical protein